MPTSNQPCLDSSGVEPDPREPLLLYWRTEMDQEHYLTCDVVELTGGFSGDLRYLKINGTRPMPLNRAEFQVLLVIMCQNRTARGLRVPRAIYAQSRYLTGREIVGAVREWSAEVPAAAWNGEDDGVFNVISKLRKKLSRKGFPRLFETLKELDGGYRLSTPPFNQIINLRTALLP
ncbi:MAG TPA: helix-turn-helix domain-containing protein [Verrucomicrobiae bacterium]|jgi:hypothetical protein|nr:helix-turn-helix domain-containing protein [Verrucomicrobiae bacterium]